MRKRMKNRMRKFSDSLVFHSISSTTCHSEHFDPDTESIVM